MSRLDTETAEQPEVLARLVRRSADHGGALRELATGCRGIVLAARGSSDNAARYAQYLVPLRSGLPATRAQPSLSTVYGRAPRMDDQPRVLAEHPSLLRLRTLQTAERTRATVVLAEPGCPMPTTGRR